MDDRPQRWLVYVQWPNGKRDTLSTYNPAMTNERCVILARVPEPRVATYITRTRPGTSARHECARVWP